ncbi:DUF4362 domain-containing protein [Paenibacillus kobensis]|uniref:DUF4362 domain-containing protein n=1 Tax=Paenibacillus kobensis TaxID=59841 RepID=UPI0013E39364|nr:DUF4362 domain-containing protein [Paenibacillus kobensis]
MIKWWITTAAILLLLSGCGSDNSTGTSGSSTTASSTKAPDAPAPRKAPSFPAVSDPYSAEQAEANGDVVNVHGKLLNEDRWKLFLSNLDVGIPDQVRITTYTTEGHPIWDELVYDGAEAITYTYDNSRDGFGVDLKRPSTICRAVELKPQEGERAAHYALTGCDSSETGGYFWFEAATDLDSP